MTPPAADWHLMVAGPLEQASGGYLFDARIVAQLRQRAHRITVHTLHGRFPQPDQDAEASLEHALSTLPDGARVVLDGLCAGAQPEVIRRHAGRLRLIALVHHLLGDESGLPPEAARALLALEQAQLQSCRGCIVTSRTTADRVQALVGQSLPLRVVEPGTERCAPAAPDPSGPPQLLCVGSVVPRKAQHVLVEALAQIADLPWQCHCVGSLARDTAYADRVRDAIRAHGLADRVLLHGELTADAVAARYHNACVFVLPSLHEGYGMACTEAMMRGLPVITTSAGALSRTIPEDAGLRVPPGDSTALADALRQCLTSPALRQRLGTAARRHALALPDWAQAADHFADALEALA